MQSRQGIESNPTCDAIFLFKKLFLCYFYEGMEFMCKNSLLVVRAMG